jgi:hypothetical protein
MRFLSGMLASLLVMPAWANGSWRVVLETPAEVVAIDLSSFQRGAGRISFRERSTLRGGQTAPHSLRPMREILAKRMIDCQTQRIATLSRAVFSDDDALIDHLTAHPRHAEWQPVEKDEPVFRLVCGLNPPSPLSRSDGAAPGNR